MSRLTDLEIRKQITLILINDKFPKAASIEYDDRQLCFWVETSGFSSWPLENPLTDDALCFMLMVKYGVTIGPCQMYKNMFLAFTYSEYEIKVLPKAHESSANKAICLAIIEHHKQTIT